MTPQKREKQLFGTNGVRGIVGRDMNPDLALNIGMALGSMRKGVIAVGRDTRTSGPALASALKAGILATGCDVIDCGMLPTPALQYLVRSHYDGGAMVTASHNPPEYNGIKIIEPDGTEMGDEETLLLESRIFSRDFTIAAWDRSGRETSAPHLVEEYVGAVAGAFPPGIGTGICVAVDPGCGAAAFTTAEILTRMGCRVFSINSQPDGTFPGRMPEPSQDGLIPLGALVRATHAAFGVAHDGDADRAVFLDENGVYIEENQQFALIEDHLCRDRRGLVVTPVSTSRLAEKIAGLHGCEVVYTPVGSIYVARTMIALCNQGKEVIFGGEGNGGLIYPGHQFCRDGAMTAAMMVSLLAGRKATLSSLVARLPSHYMIKEKIETGHASRILAAVREHYSADSLDLTDGIRINRSDVWALIRASGTEPLVRVVVESQDPATARTFSTELMRVILAQSNP